MYVCLSVCLSVDIYVCLSVCLSVDMYVCLSVDMYVRVSGQYLGIFSRLLEEISICNLYRIIIGLFSIHFICPRSMSQGLYIAF